MATPTRTPTPSIPQPESAHPGTLDAAREEAAVVAGRARGESTKVLEEARRTLRSQSDQQMERFAATAHDVARQLDALASGRGGTDGPVADLAHEAASRIAALADRLDAEGIDGIAAELKQYARRRPGTYLVGAFALGIGAGRAFRNADTGALSQAARPPANDHTDDPSIQEDRS